MAKAKITIRSVVYETYEIDVPDDVMELHEEDETIGYIQDYFLTIENDDLAEYHVDTECF